MNPRALELERRMDPVLTVAALLTLPAILMEDSAPRGAVHIIGYLAGLVEWALFVAEVVIMLSVVDSRSRWLRDHPLEVAIAVLTPPFLLSAFQGLRILRSLRLFRLARLGARLFTTEGLRYVSLLALLVLLSSAEAFASVEHVSYPEALYWALSTMTTVGYGDVVPHSTDGKIVAATVMIVGISFFAILTGAVAQRFLAMDVTVIESREDELLAQMEALGTQLRRLEQQVSLQGEQAPVPGAPAKGGDDG